MPVAEFFPARSSAEPTPTPEPEEGFLTADDLVAVSIDAADAARLVPVVIALVDRFAPDAPDAIRKEAAIRVAGWLYESPSSGIRRESVGPMDVSFSPTMTGALRASGAMALLGPWKVRRAGALA